MAKARRQPEQTSTWGLEAPVAATRAHWRGSERLPTGRMIRTLLQRDKERPDPAPRGAALYSSLWRLQGNVLALGLPGPSREGSGWSRRRELINNLGRVDGLSTHLSKAWDLGEESSPPDHFLSSSYTSTCSKFSTMNLSFSYSQQTRTPILGSEKERHEKNSFH